jgi:hypothetical protein
MMGGDGDRWVWLSPAEVRWRHCDRRRQATDSDDEATDQQLSAASTTMTMSMMKREEVAEANTYGQFAWYGPF